VPPLGKEQVTRVLEDRTHTASVNWLIAVTLPLIEEITPAAIVMVVPSGLTHPS